MGIGCPLVPSTTGPQQPVIAATCSKTALAE
jgi:hypothetical protein